MIAASATLAVQNKLINELGCHMIGFFHLVILMLLSTVERLLNLLFQKPQNLVILKLMFFFISCSPAIVDSSFHRNSYTFVALRINFLGSSNKDSKVNFPVMYCKENSLWQSEYFL